MIPVAHGKPETGLIPWVDLYQYPGSFKSANEDLPGFWRLHLSRNDGTVLESDYLLFLVDPDGDLRFFCKLWKGKSDLAGTFLYGICGKCQLLVFANGHKKAPLSVYWSARCVDNYEIDQIGELDVA